MDVSDVLRDRMQEPVGLQRMVMISGGAHLVLLLVIVFAPGGWFSARSADTRSVMTISLGGGTPGPEAGGLTSIGGRPVQQVRPPEERPRPEPVRPPAAKPPEMTAPAPNAPRTRPAPAPSVAQAPPEARGRTPTRGAEVSAGTAIAETGARGQGFGLSTGGSEGNGVQLDVGDFCCPDYIKTMVERVRANWNDTHEVPGDVWVKFTIQKDGRLTDVTLSTPSRFDVLNLSAQRAVLLTRTLPPLPPQFPHATLTVNLQFEYTR